MGTLLLPDPRAAGEAWPDQDRSSLLPTPTWSWEHPSQVPGCGGRAWGQESGQEVTQTQHHQWAPFPSPGEGGKVVTFLPHPELSWTRFWGQGTEGVTGASQSTRGTMAVCVLSLQASPWSQSWCGCSPGSSMTTMGKSSCPLALPRPPQPRVPVQVLGNEPLAWEAQEGRTGPALYLNAASVFWWILWQGGAKGSGAWPKKWQGDSRATRVPVGARAISCPVGAGMTTPACTGG